MTKPFVVCIILNTNRRDDTLECLDSLSKNNYSNFKTLVLDNHSTDGSVEAIQNRFPEVQIIPIGENRGYAGNNNVGIQAALGQQADWVFILNEDTILDPECLALLMEEATKNAQIGIVGPMVYHHDEPNIIQSAGGLLGPHWQSIHLGKDEKDTGQWQKPHEVEWISGCAIMVRRQLIEQVGMIDERFFYYWEETEWCIRARKAGWRIVHVPVAQIWHKGVQRNYTPPPSLMYYSTRNRLLTLKKHKAPISVISRAWFEILRTLVSWSVKPKWRSMRIHRDAMLQGSIDFLRRRWGKKGS